MIDLDQLIRQTGELAPLPATTVRLAQLTAHPGCQLGDVVELIAYDQSLTVRLLRAANSAMCAGSAPASTVRDAVARLGTAQVMELAVASGVRPYLQAGIPAYGLGEGALWRHAIAAAVCAETAPGFCTVAVPPETFTAALLHDVGKLVMGRFLSPEILGFIRRAREADGLGQLEAESLLLNVHHGELGGLVAQHWKLPSRIVQGIIYHHNPEAGADLICDLTCLANHGAKVIEAGLDGRTPEFTLNPGVAERLGLTLPALEAFHPAAAARFAQVSGRYHAL